MNKQTLIRLAIAAVVLIGFGAVALASMRSDGGDMSQMGPMNETTTQSSDGADSENKMTEPNQITYKGFEVVQEKIKVKKGTTVTWTNEDNAKHDVTPTEETEDFKASELFGKGETYSVTFNTVGSFDYFCSPHPYMKGTVEVVE